MKAEMKRKLIDCRRGELTIPIFLLRKCPPHPRNNTVESMAAAAEPQNQHPFHLRLIWTPSDLTQRGMAGKLHKPEREEWISAN